MTVKKAEIQFLKYANTRQQARDAINIVIAVIVITIIDTAIIWAFVHNSTHLK